MKKGWEICNLEDYIKLIDYRGRTPVKTETGVRLITAKNVKLGYLQLEPQEFINPNNYESWMTRGIPNFGDVIFTTEAPLANVAQLDTTEKVAFAQRIIVMQPQQNKLNQTFLKYLLLSDLVRNKILDKGTGATVQGIKSSLLKKIPIPIPPISEQLQIVSILDEAFAAIAKAKENVQRNLQNAKELFQSELNNVFSTKGDGWEEKNFLEVCTLKSGTTISANLEKESGEIAYLKVADMNFEGNENRVTTSSRFVNKNEINENSILPIGTIIFPKRGGAIATNKKRITDIPICVDLNIMGAIANQNMYSEFLFYYFKKFNLIDISNGTTILQINNYSFEPLKISFPKSIQEQKKIVHQLDTLSTETKNLENIYQQKLNALEELKKSILQKAFSGELTAKEKTEI